MPFIFLLALRIGLFKIVLYFHGHILDGLPLFRREVAGNRSGDEAVRRVHVERGTKLLPLCGRR